MNLPNESTCYPGKPEDWHAGFAEGHRDARHAAAELAIASPKAEIVAWWRLRPGSGLKWADGHVDFASASRSPADRFIAAGWTPLYASPQAEPAKMKLLTDVEIAVIVCSHNTGRAQGDYDCARAIECAAFKKNGLQIEGGAT